MKEGRVLVVDDDPMVRETLGQVLSDEGYVVDLAVDGESALERVHAARPDAILLDLMMPGMNGRQFLEALRGMPAHVDIPVMIMTAVHGLEVNLATLGASEVVEKPFNVDELLNKVALAVYRSRDAHKSISQPLPYVHVPPQVAGAQPEERGVVLIVEHDRRSLQELDVALSERGYTVVSMTRALVQLSRLARALQPRAILLDLESDGIHDVFGELRAERSLDQIPILVFARAAIAHDKVDPARHVHVLVPATDGDLVNFVEKARPT
ncbi:MAG: response regulator [Deltaproteobacteria bacterium]|nr:response regulator [Deltaproteobacteria bacterium]MCW5807362.1 response regulator [Deltaproteobacteria bacterium]